jgi:ribulose-bisphosphate carboxylase small chain
MWGNPLFDLRSATGAMTEVLACRTARPQAYIRVNAFDATRGFETTRLSFIVNRPHHEPGFLLKRHEVGGRQIQYTLESYAAQLPEGRRYE